MGHSKVTAHYWRHKCPANCPEDGDDAASNHPNSKYIEIPLLDRLSPKPGKCLLGKKCSAAGCQYVVNEETVLLNKYKEEIQNIGGKNLYPRRTDPVYMRCCKWWCRHAKTRGHSVDNPNFHELDNHHCVHALRYQDVMHNRKIQSRLPGCTCVMLNPYQEPVETWEPGLRRGEPIPGGPLDLDNKYHERKSKQVTQEADEN